MSCWLGPDTELLALETYPVTVVSAEQHGSGVGWQGGGTFHLEKEARILVAFSLASRGRLEEGVRHHTTQWDEKGMKILLRNGRTYVCAAFHLSESCHDSTSPEPPNGQRQEGRHRRK